MSEESQEEIVAGNKSGLFLQVLSYITTFIAGAAIPFLGFQKTKVDLAESYKEQLLGHEVVMQTEANKRFDQVIALQQELVQAQILQFDLLDDKISSSLANVVNADVKAGLEKRYLDYSRLVSKYKSSNDGTIYFSVEKIESQSGVWAGDMIEYGKEIEEIAIKLIRDCIDNEVQTTFRDKYNPATRSEDTELTR